MRNLRVRKTKNDLPKITCSGVRIWTTCIITKALFIMSATPRSSFHIKAHISYTTERKMPRQIIQQPLFNIPGIRQILGRQAVFQFSSVQSLSHVWLFATPWTAARQASLSITNSPSLLKLMSIESVMPSNHPTRCRPLLPSIFPSIRVFSNESVLRLRWPKYWSFSFCISPFNEYSGLISFRTDWLDLLAVEGTLKSLLQHHSSKASILQFSAFFTAQLSHPYMTTGKTITLTRGPLSAK